LSGVPDVASGAWWEFLGEDGVLVYEQRTAGARIQTRLGPAED
jgi:hypothetical protein